MDTSVYLLRHQQGNGVETLSMQDLANACRLFMELAYADSLDSIPNDKRAYYDIAANGAIADFLPPSPRAVAVCQDLSKVKGVVAGYEFRLGSSKHPHLKLRIQLKEVQTRKVWVYSVDTHDRFLQATQHLSAAEADAWKSLVEANRVLKHQIEEALARQGFLTPINLLRLGLTTPTA